MTTRRTPYTIEGHNVEDPYGFTWGFNSHQTHWIGCPNQQNPGRNDQDGVFYRLFGPDPIAISSSITFLAGSRGSTWRRLCTTTRNAADNPSAGSASVRNELQTNFLESRVGRLLKYPSHLAATG